MKYKTKSLETDGVILSPAGDNIDSSLYLDIDPSVTQQGIQNSRNSVSKQYVLDKLEQINGTQFKSGIIGYTCLPNFNGDLVKPLNSNQTTLVKSLVSPGSYAKVTVDVKGIVLTGGNLTEGDVPNLSWDKVNINRPTTLEGYGISNALSVNGGQLTGPLKVSVYLEQDHLTTKQAVDDFVKLGNIEVGGMVLKISSEQVPNFLRCNGGEVSKEIYSDLYSVIGDSYSVSYSSGFGLPHLYQLDFNFTSTTTDSWSSRGTLPERVNSGGSLVTKNKVFIIGGSDTVSNSGSLNTIYSATINSDGSIGSWSLYGRLPIEVDSFGLVVNVNIVYLIGGRTNGSDISTIYSTTISDEGELGSWSLIGNLPFVLSNMSVLITKNLLTVIGGSYNGSGVLNVMQVVINKNGSLGNWYSGPSLPGARLRTSLFVTKNFVYLAGGSNGSSALSSVIKSSINTDGTLSDWTNESNIPATLQDMSVVCSGSRVYLIGGGGTSSVSTSNRVYSAPVNQDGSIGSWVTNSNLSEAVRCSQVFITSSRLYICGGFRSITRINAVRSCNFTGGLNDYSEFYQSVKRATENGFFRLPDAVSPVEVASYFIRY